MLLTIFKNKNHEKDEKIMERYGFSLLLTLIVCLVLLFDHGLPAWIWKKKKGEENS